LRIVFAGLSGWPFPLKRGADIALLTESKHEATSWLRGRTPGDLEHDKDCRVAQDSSFWKRSGSTVE
jgi:hypothetical protein